MTPKKTVYNTDTANHERIIMSDGFNLSMRTEYCQVTSYSPIEGWEEDLSDDEKELVEKMMEVCPRNDDEARDLRDQFSDKKLSFWKLRSVRTFFHPKGYIDIWTKGIDTVNLYDLFPDAKELYPARRHRDEVFEILFPETFHGKFFYATEIEFSEGDFEWCGDCSGEYDPSKLVYENGQVLYEGTTFSCRDDGSPSIGMGGFYRDGEYVCR